MSIFEIIAVFFVGYMAIRISYPQTPYLLIGIWVTGFTAHAVWGFTNNKPQPRLFPLFQGEKRKSSIAFAIVTAVVLGLIAVWSLIMPIPSRVISEQFLTLVASHHFHNARGLLAPKTQKQISERDLKAQWDSVEKRYGKPLSWKFINEEPFTTVNLKRALPIIYQLRGSKRNVKIAFYITDNRQNTGVWIVKYEIPSQYKN